MREITLSEAKYEIISNEGKVLAFFDDTNVYQHIR